MPSSSAKNIQLAIIAAAGIAVLVADQIAKAFIVATIPHGSVAPKHETFFWLTHERNFGLVGGAFRGVPWVTYLAPIAAALVLIYLFRHLNPKSVLQSLAYGLVAGGATGNLVDRVRLGWVTDFLQVHFYFIPVNFPWKMWPAFNIADSAICVGVAILVFGWGRQEEPGKEAVAGATLADDRPRST